MVVQEREPFARFLAPDALLKTSSTLFLKNAYNAGTLVYTKPIQVTGENIVESHYGGV